MEHGYWNMQWKMERDIEWNMQWNMEIGICNGTWKLEHAMENGMGYRMEHAMEWNLFNFYKSQNSSVPCSCVCSNCNRNPEQTHGTHANN